ncbi:hypothetical protein ACFLXI_08895, partial [Chloroflexota bacterium]
MNLTLVAYYGREKPSKLQDFIDVSQESLIRDLGEAFKPYTLDQIHGTIIGLEGIRVGDEIINTNYLNISRKHRSMRLARMIEVVKDRSFLPFSVQIGGYKAGEIYPFMSRGTHPYLRSFSIQGESAVAMGWPVEESVFPLPLDQLRRKMGEANLLHKYHLKPGDIDNDFYFVLGTIDRDKLSETDLQSTQEGMRALLAARDPLKLTIGPENLSIVAYHDPQLPL